MAVLRGEIATHVSRALRNGPPDVGVIADLNNFSAGMVSLARGDHKPSREVTRIVHWLSPSNEP